MLLLWPSTPGPIDPVPLPMPDPAPDPCVVSPLSFTVTRWPNWAPGSRRLDFRWSGTDLASVTFTSTTATATNRAGCTKTVTKA